MCFVTIIDIKANYRLTIVIGILSRLFGNRPIYDNMIIVEILSELCTWKLVFLATLHLIILNPTFIFEKSFPTF